MHRQIFNTCFNLSFHKPKKDRCKVCEIHTREDAPSTSEAKERFIEHLKNKEKARSEKASDKERSVINRTHKSITFDLQKVLNVPCGDVSNLYYSRKLAVYNFTIYEQDTKKGLCNLWEEYNGKRGSSEIGSCIYQYLINLPQEISSVSMFSDRCAGQNHNRFMCTALYMAVQDSHTLEVVDQKYLVPGHTQMEVDSIHATIENTRKNMTVYVPSDWCNVIRTARRHRPYELKQ